MLLSGKKILLGVTGSIAAYKAASLIRMLIREGASVQVVMTPAANDFITPLTLSTLSQRPVLIEPFQADTGEWHSHIELALWADLFLIAPATANTLAKMANGLADNLLVAVYLAARCPVIFAPVMDVDMYEHPSTKNNISRLIGYGNLLIPPDEGELASGLMGKGRMKEPQDILDFLLKFTKKKSPLSGKSVLVTAGPTYEKIDPVRFIGNFSSGKMGFALAEAFARAGAKVTLVSGPTQLSLHQERIDLIRVTSAKEMSDECNRAFPGSDITVMAAAVADYTPSEYSGTKLKKKESMIQISLKPTEDILAGLGKKKMKKQLLAGFALETDNETENALKKIKNKKLDFIVLNSLNDKGAGFGHDTNKVSIIDSHGRRMDLPLMKKDEVADSIVDYVIRILA